eukprot:TRINITY_DN5538_c0_g1_i1.p1 TRINITY_DN5538_c0_g1~~TRINITY_DN5538_c0_g1_i1.p1  ORF type:complete len:274 (-),score=42.99 TRINITY_DN5538_c0_g1_i1:974-1795(-)
MEIECNDSLTVIENLELEKEIRLSPMMTHLILSSSGSCSTKSNLLADAILTGTSLRSVELSGCNFGNKGIGVIINSLKRLGSLKNLGLRDNLVSLNGALDISDYLKENSTLLSLDLGRNNIGEEGILLISESLKVNTTLTRLDLGDNQLCANGAKHISEFLKVNTTLQDLNISSNTLRREGAEFISESLTNMSLASLDISHNYFGPPGGTYIIFNALRMNSLLEDLNFACTYILFSSSFLVSISSLSYIIVIINATINSTDTTTSTSSSPSLF